ncbi:hypothetical protein [Alkalibacillus haloalkaliphilus]|uniref:hypothetical protein n=1 Tax=Alkalibacillus haloalkaliphilus TaxID=94136 RepID=UPI0012FE5E79|nr:hypothetical protein [Alkalibacillus haloalkaliphilus]
MLGMFSNPLHINQISKDLSLYSNELLLKFCKQKSHKLHYWRIIGAEYPDGDDFLALFEQKDPYPFEYELTEEPNQDHIIACSSFSTEHNLITKVHGYGFSKNSGEYLSSIVLEVEHMYIMIYAGQVLQIKVTEQEPRMLNDDLLFSSLN